MKEDPLANIQKAKWCLQALAPFVEQVEVTEYIGIVFARSVVGGIIVCQ